MTVVPKCQNSFRKQKLVAIKCNARKKQFVVQKRSGKVVSVGYHEQPLDHSQLGYTKFNLWRIQVSYLSCLVDILLSFGLEHSYLHNYLSLCDVSPEQVTHSWKHKDTLLLR